MATNNRQTVRTSRFHNQVEQDVRTALASFGIPSHLVEFERMANDGRRATFMLYINGEEVFDEPKFIEFVQTTIIDGFQVAKACINFAKTLKYNQMNADVAEPDTDGEEDEGDEADVIAEAPAPAPAPTRRRQRQAKSTPAPAPRPTVVDQPMRLAAARDGTSRTPARKKFGANIPKGRNAFKRPNFIQRMVD